MPSRMRVTDGGGNHHTHPAGAALLHLTRNGFGYTIEALLVAQSELARCTRLHESLMLGLVGLADVKGAELRLRRRPATPLLAFMCALLGLGPDPVSVCVCVCGWGPVAASCRSRRSRWCDPRCRR